MRPALPIAPDRSGSRARRRRPRACARAEAVRHAARAAVRVSLITRDLETPYSGMLPGYVAGLYSFAECHIDLVRLARFAGARLIHDEAVGLDRAARHMLCRDHPPIRYDVVVARYRLGAAPRRCARRRRAHRRGQADRPFRSALGSAARARRGRCLVCGWRSSAAAPAGSSWRWRRSTGSRSCSAPRPR